MIDYTFLTLFQHYKLYQFVLTKDRADRTTKLYYTIEPPPTTLHMREGLAKSIWDEQQKLKQIEQMQQHRCEVRYTTNKHLIHVMLDGESYPLQHHIVFYFFTLLPFFMFSWIWIWTIIVQSISCLTFVWQLCYHVFSFFFFIMMVHFQACCVGCISMVIPLICVF